LSLTKDTVVEEFRIRAIREAVLRVVSRKGLAAATMQEIAREAGVAKGTLYLYFESRDQLIQRTAESAFGELLARLEQLFAEPAPLAEKVRSLVSAMLGFFESNREFFRLYLAMCHPQGDYRNSRWARRHHPRYGVYLERFGGFLAAAMADGEARGGEPSRIAHFIAEGLNAIILRRLTEAAVPPLEEEVDWLVELVLRGIAVPGAPERAS
jgi:AcrR family transcriptional regulator